MTVATVATGGLEIVTAGKGYTDLLQTLTDLGLELADLIHAGVGVLKIGMIWPLEPRRIREYARRAKTLFVIEQKRPFLEDQVKSVLYGLSQGERPSVVGKTQSDGSRLLAASSALSSIAIAKALIAVLPPQHYGKRQLLG